MPRKFTKSIIFAETMNAKSILIMGATSGIGREVAEMFARKGWKVGACGRRGELLESLRAQYPQNILTMTADVNAPDTGERLAAFANELTARVYLHCSGIGWQNARLDPEKELSTLRTNGEGFARCVGAVFRHFSATGGHIAVVSSIAGTKGLGPAPAYSATKRFQNTYIDALEQLAWQRRLGITFTDIRPGFVATDLIGGGKGYPMVMKKEKVAAAIVRAVERKRRVAVIDWRYAALVTLWRLMPRFLWKRLPIVRDAH